jgi:hypothetical protein
MAMIALFWLGAARNPVGIARRDLQQLEAI